MKKKLSLEALPLPAIDNGVASSEMDWITLIWKSIICCVKPRFYSSAPLAVEPSHFLVKAGLGKSSHACRDIVTAVLGPPFMVTVASSLNQCSEVLHEGIHSGIHIFNEPFPVRPHSFLESREFGYFSNPPRTAIVRQILIDEIIEQVRPSHIDGKHCRNPTVDRISAWCCRHDACACSSCPRMPLGCR